MGQSYQSVAIEGTKAFFLKRNVPFSTNTRVKVSLQKLHFINSPLCVKCIVPEFAKLQKTRKDAKTSAQVSFE